MDYLIINSQQDPAYHGLSGLSSTIDLQRVFVRTPRTPPPTRLVCLFVFWGFFLPCPENWCPIIHWKYDLLYRTVYSYMDILQRFFFWRIIYWISFFFCILMVIFKQTYRQKGILIAIIPVTFELYYLQVSKQFQKELCTSQHLQTVY